MKKIFAIAALLLAGSALASAQYVTKAYNDVTGNYDKFDWAHAHNFVPIAGSGMAPMRPSKTVARVVRTPSASKRTTLPSV